MNGKFLLKHIAKWRLLYVVTLLASLSFAGVNAFDNYAPTVVSDKDDYSPGQTAIIEGYGWEQDSLVDIHLEEDPAHDHHHGYHDTKVNPDGTWRIEYPIEDRHLGVAFTVIVDGKQSGKQVLHYFTDSRSDYMSTLSSSAECSGGTVNLVLKNISNVPTGGGNTTNRTFSSFIVKIPAGVTITPLPISGWNINTNENGELRYSTTSNSISSGNSISVPLQISASAAVTFNLVTTVYTASDFKSNSGANPEFILTNANNIPISVYPSLTVNPLPATPAASSNSPVIEGGILRLTASTIANAIYSWSGPNGFTSTDQNPVISNVTLATAGIYLVTAKVGDCTSAEGKVSVVISPKNTTTLTVAPASGIYGGTTALRAILASETTTLSGQKVNFSLNGVSVGIATTDANGEAILNDVSLQGINAGEYNNAISAVFSGDATYSESRNTANLSVDKAEQSITWNNPASITYGTALSVTQLNASALENAALTYTPEAGTVLDAGDKQTLSVTAAETNNYKTATATVLIDVAKATPTVLLTVGGPYTYDGAAKSVSSATVSGVGNADLGAATVNYKKGDVSVEAPVNAGVYEVLASFAGNDNYEAATANGTLVIEKAEATLTASNVSGKVYNGLTQGITVTTSPDGLNSGVTIQYFLEGIAVTASEVNKAGSYTYTASLEHPNYAAEAISGSFSINQATLTISAVNASKVYGDQNPDFLASVVSGAVQGESFNVTASSVANAGSDVGDYPIVPAVTGATLDNYTVVKNNGTLAISARPITVTANSGQAKVYGEADPAAYTYQLTSGSLVEANHMTGALDRDAGDNVGTYTINKGTLAATSNYALTYVAADFAITRRQVTVTADALSKVYGDSDPELTYTVAPGSVVSGDNFSGSLKRVAGESVSTYAVGLGTLSLGSNYSLSLTEGTLFTIMPMAITVTPAAGQNKVYGSTDPVFSYTTNTALVGNDAFTGALSRNSGENVGRYAITRGSLALSDNYTLDVVETVTFQITPKALVASITASDKVYDGTTSASATGSVPATDLVDGDVVMVDIKDAAFDTRSVGNAKTVSAAVSIDNENYSLSNSTATTTASITPKEISGAFAAANKVYDGTTDAAVTERSLQGVIDQDVVQLVGGTADFSDKNVAKGKTVTLAGVTLSGADMGNYFLSGVSTALADITPKPASVSPVATAKVYGTADPALSGTTDGFLAADGIMASYTRTPGEQVDLYLISATLSPAEAVGNYDVTYKTAQFEITKATLVVTADNKSKVYGDENPQFTGTLEGVVRGDDIEATYNTVATVASPVQTYPITPSLSGAALSNYEVEKRDGVLTITKAALSVKANDATKVYGDVNPDFTGVITGIKNSDAIVASYQSAATASSVIGDYAIEPSLTGDALSNYDVTVMNGTLSITKAAISVVANDKTRIYGIANPALDGVLTGVKNNDAITASYSTAANEASNVGEYAITVALNDPDSKLSNYTVSNTSGKLTITQAPATITVADLNKVYNRTAQGATVSTGPANLDVIVTYEGSSVAPTAAGSYAVVAKLNNSNYSADEVLATLAIAQKEVTATLAHAGKVYDGTTAAPGTTATLDGVISPDDVTTNVTDAVFNNANAGARTVTATVLLAGDDKANYTLQSVTPASATISPRAVTVAAEAKSKVYGDNDPALTYTLKAGSLVQGESFSGELKREAGEAVGSYAIIQNTLTAGGNYAITYEAADLTITPRAITITADEKSKVYGEVDPALTYQISTGTLVNGDDFTGSLNRLAGENVGAYAIGKGTLALSSNYALTYAGANLNISPLGVTVTADAKQKYCGQVDPSLTFTSSPAEGSMLPNGDLITFSGSLTRESGENVGSHSIKQGSLANSNYTISYIPSNLDVLGVSIDASASSKPVAVGSSASLSATVTAGATGIVAVPVTFTVKDDTGKAVSKIEAITDGSGIASAVVPSSLLPLGVYKVEAMAGNGCATSNAYIPVFDASGSFVTGGGWIDSPVGAMPANPEAVGKANFGFVSKYKKGSSQVDGNTEFQFSAGSVNFKSTMHESGSLVIAAGKATYRGTGTVNGASGYKFTIVAIDGDWKGATEADRFRIKIVDGRGQTVYDNQIGKDENGSDATILGNNGTGGGSIVIHEAKELTASNGKKLETADQLEGLSSARFDNYPNAFSDRTTIRFAFDTEQHFALEVYDVRGSLIRKVATGKADAGQVYEYELDARHLAEGVYFARLITGSKAQTIKMILKK